MHSHQGPAAGGQQEAWGLVQVLVDIGIIKPEQYLLAKYSA
jgi:hypothetical protein